ncbi:MAG: hypothetical protein KJ857_00445, partial [Proteobacteria bacterium]|nr:hypothetical protein [Pseudomonadota bacterium]
IKLFADDMPGVAPTLCRLRDSRTRNGGVVEAVQADFLLTPPLAWRSWHGFDYSEFQLRPNETASRFLMQKARVRDLRLAVSSEQLYCALWIVKPD